MAPKPKPWFRLYTETTRDRKIRRLKPEARWLWITVLSLARQSPRHGWLLVSDGSPINVDDLSDEAALPAPSVRRGLAALRSAEMLEEVDGVLHVTNWDARQFESDRSTERVAKGRSKGPDATPDAASMERPIAVDVTAPENREQRTDTPKPAGTTPTAATVLAKRACVALALTQIAPRVAAGVIADPAAVAELRAKTDLWPILGDSLTVLAEQNPEATAEQVAALCEVDSLTGHVANGRAVTVDARPGLSSTVADQIRQQAAEAAPDALGQLRAIRGGQAS